MATSGTDETRDPVWSAELVIESSASAPEEMAGLIGLEPDEAWRMGQRRGPRSTATHRLNGIVYRSRVPETEPMSAHLADLVTRLAPRAAALRELAPASGEGVRLWLTVTTPEVDPVVRLDSDAVRFANQIGAAVEISVLVLSPSHL